MRVEIVTEITNLRSKPFEEASGNPALTNFRTAVCAKESFFHLQDSVAGFQERSGQAHGTYVGRFVIAFRRLDLSADRNLYFILLQALQEPLKNASSSDALFATMCVTAPVTDATHASEPYLILQLEALGVTPEQAELRWGLGLQRVQEALLSASDLLREHLVPTKTRVNRDLPPGWSPQASQEGKGSERRRSPRYPFIAEAEVTEIASDTKLNAKTSDLGTSGCFLDMLNASPEGTEVRVRISHAGMTFTAFGKVASVLRNMGMGVAFRSVEEDQLAVLQEWLSQLSGDE